MKFPRIAIIFLLSILIASGLACSLLGLGGETEPTPTPTPPPITSAPTLSSPNNGATVYGTSITFQWNASPGATAYGLRVSNSAYPNLDKETEFFSITLGAVLEYTSPHFSDDGTEYVWGVWSGNAAGWCDKSEVLANARILTNGVPYGASLTPKYMRSGNQNYFLLTAYAKEPAHLDISNPDGSLLDRVYIPPMVEKEEITENVYLPPVPSGGTYRLQIYNELTGELVSQGEQTFAGPKLEILELSLNPHWVQGVGWDLQYLTTKLKNTGDMPIILHGLKLRLEKDGFSTEEITVAQPGDAGAEYGWYRKEGFTMGNGVIWGLVPFNNTFNTLATVIPWASKEQFLFGQYFDPGEYRLYITLSEQLNILPVPELAFESF